MSFGSFVLLPNIIGTSSFLVFESTDKDHQPCWDAFRAKTYQLTSFTYKSNGTAYKWSDLCMDANLSNQQYGKSITVQPKSLVLNYVVKY